MSNFRKRQSKFRLRRFRRNLLKSIGATNTSIQLADGEDMELSDQIVGSSQVLEHLIMCADGRTYIGVKANYTMGNVTGVQNLTTAHVRITGSNVNYLPPDGTKSVYYKCEFQARNTDTDPILHYAVNLSGSQISNSRVTYRSNVIRQERHYVHQLFTITGVQNNTTGTVDSWDTARMIEATAREYTADYEGRLHITNHWDGTGTDIVVKPYVTIIAFG